MLWESGREWAILHVALADMTLATTPPQSPPTPPPPATRPPPPAPSNPTGFYLGIIRCFLRQPENYRLHVHIYVCFMQILYQKTLSDSIQDRVRQLRFHVYVIQTVFHVSCYSRLYSSHCSKTQNYWFGLYLSWENIKNNRAYYGSKQN